MPTPLRYDAFNEDDEPTILDRVEPELELSEDQQNALDICKRIANEGGLAYITGKAGTGKSVCLRRAQKEIRNVIVVAPTGLAAINVGGMTVHGFFGIRPGATYGNMVAERVEILRVAKLIAFDEISMNRADIVDIVDRMMRQIMRVDLPFGGKGVVFFGDHWQIEPVVSSLEERAMIERRYGSPFFFDSYAWKASEPVVFELQQIFRQAGDDAFKDALNMIREGNGTGLDLLNTRSYMSPQTQSVRLTLTNRRADSVNATMIGRLPGELKTYKGTQSTSWVDATPTPLDLELKEGCRVMNLVNRDNICNGDTGIVENLGDGYVDVRFDRTGTVLRVQDNVWEKREFVYNPELDLITSSVVAEFRQIPLKVAYACTVHKSQGQTYDACHLEMETRVFAHGQLYVAASRCRSLEGLTITRSLNYNDIMISKRVFQWAQGGYK